VLPVMDLRRQIAPRGTGGEELTQVLAVSVDGMTFGIAVEAVEETAREHAGALERALLHGRELEAQAPDPRLRGDDA
jgi:chemotaxis signal transduction protein